MIAISGMLPEEIEGALHLSPPFRARQVFSWIAKGAVSADKMTNIPKTLREEIKAKALLRTVSLAKVLTDDDGTMKMQLLLRDGLAVESVIMKDSPSRADALPLQALPSLRASRSEAKQSSEAVIELSKTAAQKAPPRTTVCISSQAGCGCGCAFCMTGTLGFKRNLEANEIAEQFFIAQQTAKKQIDNIVLMGMGEPMLNLPNIRRTLAILSDKRGLGISLRRVTISTCGIIKGIDDMALNGPHIRLAVSLTTADEDLRRSLMPIAKDNPLPQLRQAIARYAAASGRRVTLEAALLGGKNTGAKSAKQLIDFALGLDVNINLIPWNTVECLPFKEPSVQEVKAFADMLRESSLNVTVRARHGKSIQAACGQLGR